jgi:hypothetical protein
MVKTVKAHDVNLSSKNTTSWAWLVAASNL